MPHLPVKSRTITQMEPKWSNHFWVVEKQKVIQTGIFSEEGGTKNTASLDYNKITE